MPGKDSIANRINANYFNPSREWQADFAYAESAEYKSDDNDLLLEKTIELPFTADYYMSHYIAEQVLKQSRQGLIIDFKTTQEGLLAEVGDVVYIKLDSPGWTSLNGGSGKKFRILEMSIEATDEISIVAREYDSAVYTHGILKTKDTAPNTALPDLSEVVAPTQITVTESLLYNDPKTLINMKLLLKKEMIIYL